MIEVDALERRYGGLVAVESLSFRVAPGEILGLVGPNGAGKTTTLRTLAGIDPPSGGRVAIGGHDVVGAPLAARRACGYVADEPRLFEALSVAEHLDVTASLYGLGDRRAAADALLESFELAGRRDAPVDTLSLSMRQKVAICCAYLVEPTALLFDEPLTGLDPHGIRTITRSIRERAEAGAAVVVSSHLLALVETLCTHVLVLDGGRCRLHAPMADIAGRVDGGPGGGSGGGALESAFLEITRGDESSARR